jgi:surfactin synthase thioesterase subunit
VDPVSGGRWLYDGVPGAADFLVFGFHYAGTGAAATYDAWPRKIGTGLLCPVQPPGRDDRIAEPPVRTHREFAELLAAELIAHLDRPYGLTGHCGAVPYLMETAFQLSDLGAPPPRALFASAWGPPQHGPYGRLNIEPLEEVDPLAEVQSTMQARFGFTLQPDVAEIAAETLMTDLEVQRTHSYSGEPPLPARTLVIGWDQDAVIPPSVVGDRRWAACGEVEHRMLPGDHWEYLRGPESLINLIAAEMTAERPESEHVDDRV